MLRYQLNSTSRGTLCFTVTVTQYGHYTNFELSSYKKLFEESLEVQNGVMDFSFCQRKGILISGTHGSPASTSDLLNDCGQVYLISSGHVNSFFKNLFIEVELIYSVVPVSAVQQSDSVIHV